MPENPSEDEKPVEPLFQIEPEPKQDPGVVLFELRPDPPGAPRPRVDSRVGLSLVPNLFEKTPDPDPTVPTSKSRRRAKPATLSRTGSQPRLKPREPQTPEARRALEIAEMYAVKQPLCSKQRVADAVETAIRVGAWTDGEIVAAVERLVDSPYGVTENTLRIQLGKTKQPERVVDPVIHQAIDTALEHLGRLDSEQMTVAERTLAAALRSVCVAVAHIGTELAKEN